MAVIAVTTGTVKPASAAFLYVPPEEPAQDAVEAGDGEVREPVPDGNDGDAGNAGASREARKGGAQHKAAQDRLVGDGNDHGPATVEAAVEDSDPELWRIRSGETLRGVLSRWGARGGVEVLFLTDRRYRLHEARVFEGSFAAAAHSLFASLTHLPHAPVGEARPDGRTLAVLHRAHPVGGGQ